MAILYEPGTDPSRVYYGTDTRAAGLLIGAALAVLLPPWRLKRTVGAHARWVIDGIGVLALVGLFWFFRNCDEFDPFLYQGGFLVLSVVTAVAIGVAAHPASFLGAKVLGNKVLTAIGVRSYGIYLWHWPLFMITRPDLDLPFHGYGLLIARFVVTGILAELSYRFVEIPIRQGAIGRWSVRYRAAKGDLRASMMKKAMVGGAAATLFCLVIVGGYASAKPDATPEGFGLDASSPTTVPTNGGSARTAAQGIAPGTPVPKTTTGATQPATTPGSQPATVPGATAPPGPTTAPLPYTGVVAIGDSVMLGAKGALEARMPGITVDAAVNRQVKAGADIAASMHSQGLIDACRSHPPGHQRRHHPGPVRPADGSALRRAEDRADQHQGSTSMGGPRQRLHQRHVEEVPERRVRRLEGAEQPEQGLVLERRDPPSAEGRSRLRRTHRPSRRLRTLPPGRELPRGWWREGRRDDVHDPH